MAENQLESIEDLSKRLSIEQAEKLLNLVLMRTASPNVTLYQAWVTHEGLEARMTTTGMEYARNNAPEIRNLSGQKLAEL